MTALADYFSPNLETEAESAPLLSQRTQVCEHFGQVHAAFADQVTVLKIQLAATSVYPVIQLIREDAIHYIDTALTYETVRNCFRFIETNAHPAVLARVA